MKKFILKSGYNHTNIQQWLIVKEKHLLGSDCGLTVDCLLADCPSTIWPVLHNIIIHQPLNLPSL